MNYRSTTQTKTSSFSPIQTGLLQRKCNSCGQHKIAGGECTNCQQKSGLQRKLSIGASNDPLELEADLIADRVLAAPANTNTGTSPPHIQRFTGQTTGQADVAPDSVDRVLSSPGRPLEASLQQDMGQRFGHDFSRVRVHTGDEAARSARDVNAHAYTVGNNVVFGTGRFAPRLHEGRRLIAHELTHVVQQNSRNIPEKLPLGNPENLAEFEPRRATSLIPDRRKLISNPSQISLRLQKSPRGEDDPIHRPLIERFREEQGLPLSGVDEFGNRVGPTDAEIKYGDQTGSQLSKAERQLKTGELDDTDLKYESLRTRLTGLTTSEVSDLISKIKAFQAQRNKDINDPNVKDPEKKRPITTAQIIQWLEVRKVISTPKPDKATVNSLLSGMIDSYSISINDINITVMPDTHGAGQNETKLATNFTGTVSNPQFTWVEVGGKITDLKKDGVPFNPTKLEVTILTKYKDSPNDTSVYGKGTTDSDKFNKTTTLRVHEGQHGTDLISYLTNTPLPVSLQGGINGKLTPAQFSKILNYVKNITKDTCETTDQTGFSQDEFIQTPQGKASGITSCRKP